MISRVNYKNVCVYARKAMKMVRAIKTPHETGCILQLIVYLFFQNVPYLGKQNLFFTWGGFFNRFSSSLFLNLLINLIMAKITTAIIRKSSIV